MAERIIRASTDVFAEINEERKRQGLNWKELTAKTGVSWGTIHNWKKRRGAMVNCVAELLDQMGLEMVIRAKGENEHDS